MLHCIQLFTNTCEVRKQVKRAVGKAILHKLPIYNEYMCLCWVSTLFCMICWVFFPIVVKLYYTASTHMYITFQCATFLCARTPCNAMRRSIEICLLYGQRKHFWVVFSFDRWLSFDRWTDSVTRKLTTG